MLTDAARSGALLDNLLGFGRALRRAGVPTDSSRIALAARSIDMVGLAGRDDFKSALRAVLVNRQQDLAVFDELFDAWFCEPRSQRLSMAPMLSQTAEVRPVKKRARVQEDRKSVV